MDRTRLPLSGREDALTQAAFLERLERLAGRCSTRDDWRAVLDDLLLIGDEARRHRAEFLLAWTVARLLGRCAEECNSPAALDGRALLFALLVAVGEEGEARRLWDAEVAREPAGASPGLALRLVEQLAGCAAANGPALRAPVVAPAFGAGAG